MVITIDGPAGTGKSTVSQRVSRELGFQFLDTGAMYRAIGLEAVRRGANLDDPRELAFVGKHCRIEFDWARQPPPVLLNGEVVTHFLRGAEVTRAASYVALVPGIREMLVEQQRTIGQTAADLVTEGRDQGSVVFPDAAFKFFLDASPHERARRRVGQLRARGEIVDFANVLNEIVTRDRRDAGRSVGPMTVPVDATIIDTTELSQEQVIERIVEVVRAGKRA